MLQFENPLNSTSYAFPVLECLHIVGFAFSIGTIAIVDLRLLDIALLHQTPAQLNKDMSGGTLAGLTSMVLTGLLLYSSDPDMYYLNYAFLVKIFFLLLAIVFNYTYHRKVVNGGGPPGSSKMAAYVSLVLWSLVCFGGIFIGFLNPTLDINKI